MRSARRAAQPPRTSRQGPGSGTNVGVSVNVKSKAGKSFVPAVMVLVEPEMSADATPLTVTGPVMVDGVSIMNLKIELTSITSVIVCVLAPQPTGGAGLVLPV